MLSALEALQSLREGNSRFVSGEKTADFLMPQTQGSKLVGAQEPSAVILGCSDSRVPVEIIFDQGLGELFVIRVAGNIVAPPLVGSVEFAVAEFGTRLVVVLGHSKCGAVRATLDELHRPTEGLSADLRAVIDRIQPAVEGLLKMETASERDVLQRQAVRANIRASANYLRNESETLRRLIHGDGLLVLGAEYSLETRVVDFFDGIPVNRSGT